MSYHYQPAKCTKCPAGVLIPTAMEDGGGIVCPACGQYALAGFEGGAWRLFRLDAEQVAQVKAHPNFPNIKAMQEKIWHKNGLWG